MLVRLGLEDYLIIKKNNQNFEDIIYTCIISFN